MSIISKTDPVTEEAEVEGDPMAVAIRDLPPLQTRDHPDNLDPVRDATTLARDHILAPTPGLTATRGRPYSAPQEAPSGTGPPTPLTAEVHLWLVPILPQAAANAVSTLVILLKILSQKIQINVFAAMAAIYLPRVPGSVSTVSPSARIVLRREIFLCTTQATYAPSKLKLVELQIT